MWPKRDRSAYRPSWFLPVMLDRLSLHGFRILKLLPASLCRAGSLAGPAQQVTPAGGGYDNKHLQNLLSSFSVFMTELQAACPTLPHSFPPYIYGIELMNRVSDWA